MPAYVDDEGDYTTVEEQLTVPGGLSLGTERVAALMVFGALAVLVAFRRGFRELLG